MESLMSVASISRGNTAPFIPSLANQYQRRELINRTSMTALALVAVWSVTESGLAVAATAPNLGTTAPFALVASTFTNTNAGTTLDGNVCFTTGPGTAFTLNGTKTVPCSPQVGTDEAAALKTLNGETCTSLGAGVVTLNTVVIGKNKAGTIPPGCYSSGGAMNIAASTTVTLSGSGVYIFRPTGTLGAAVSGKIALASGATAANVFWAPVGATTFGASVSFVGTIISAAGITFGNLASLSGRTLAFGGTVTLDNNLITVPGFTPLSAALLPSSRAMRIGDPANLFASIVNSGTEALQNCRVALPAGSPSGLTLDYQTTDPMSNALTGARNTPATIAGNHGQQSFLVSLHGSTPFDAPALPLDFKCDGTPRAALVPGVNTVDLSLPATLGAEIVALAATATSDGILHLSNGVPAAFSLASTNLGVTAPITVSADTGSDRLPITVSICQTRAARGECLAAPAASVLLNYDAGTTPTFSVFVQSAGDMALAPASSRVYVRFEDEVGGLNGSTSVAIETR
jgi:hypothetical protein